MKQGCLIVRMMFMLLGIFISSQVIASDVVYEDAEDGAINRWSVFDSTPAGALVNNVFDTERNSRVVELIGVGADNGYILGNWRGRQGAWGNSQEKKIQWSMKFDEKFYIYINVETLNGQRYVYYTNLPEGDNFEAVYGSSKYIHYGLGSSSINGSWQTFTRDLETDLKTFEEGNSVVAVNAFFVRGSGRLDDVKMNGSKVVSTNSGNAGVVLTFDDRSVDLWYEYFKNKELGVKATFYVHAWHALSDDEVEKLRVLQSRGHEIAAHSYSHKGVIRDYAGDVNRIQEYLNREIVPAIENMRVDGFNPVSFAYPYGETTDNYNAALKPYFRSLRTTTYSGSRRPLETLDPIYSTLDDLDYVFSGDGIDIAVGNDVPEIKRAFDRASRNDEIITLVGHRIYPDNHPNVNFTYGLDEDRLDRIIEAAKARGLRFYTAQELFE